MKRPQDDDDEIEEESQMERQRRRARERRLAEEAATSSSTTSPPVSSTTTRRPGAPSAPNLTPYEIAHPHLIQPTRAKVRKLASEIAKKVDASRNKWRVCEAIISSTGAGLGDQGATCRRQVIDNPMATMCWRCRTRLQRFGSPRRTRHVRPRAYHHFTKRARKLIRTIPPGSAGAPSAQVLEAVAGLLIPPMALRKGHVGYKKRQWLITEVCRWTEPRYRSPNMWYRPSRSRPFQYQPVDLLAFLVGITAYIEQRPDSWPGESDQIETAYALIRLWKRPGGPGGPKRNPKHKTSSIIYGSVLRGVAKRIRDSTVLGVYMLTTARRIVADLDREQETANQKYLARARQREQDALAAAQAAAQAKRAAFDALPVLNDPGPRPHIPRGMDMDVTYMNLINNWAASVTRFNAYQTRRREYYL